MTKKAPGQSGAFFVVRAKKKRGRRIASPFVYRGFSARSVYVDRDLLWLRLVGLGHVDFQYAVPVRRFDSIALDGLREVKRAREFTGNALGPLILNPAGRCFSFAFATEA